MSSITVPSSFTETFVGFNCPETSASFRWSFKPGMLFQDYLCWWKPAKRRHPHEGVDFFGYHAGGNPEPRRVGSDIVPALYDGVAVKIDDDFLGKTVWIAHEGVLNDQRILFSALGHILPEQAIREGEAVRAGEPVGRIAPQRQGSALGMHLHLSVFWAPSFFRVDRLDWPKLHAIREIQLFDPLSIVSRSA